MCNIRLSRGKRAYPVDRDRRTGALRLHHTARFANARKVASEHGSVSKLARPVPVKAPTPTWKSCNRKVPLWSVSFGSRRKLNEDHIGMYEIPFLVDPFRQESRGLSARVGPPTSRSILCGYLRKPGDGFVFAQA